MHSDFVSRRLPPQRLAHAMHAAAGLQECARAGAVGLERADPEARPAIIAPVGRQGRVPVKTSAWKLPEQLAVPGPDSALPARTKVAATPALTGNANSVVHGS